MADPETSPNAAPGAGQIPEREPLERDLSKVGTLWHYTTLASLTGIIRSKTLWCTDAEFLNDSEEIRHASHYLQRAWDEAARLLEHTGAGGSFGANSLQRFLVTARTGAPVQVELKDEPAPFVTSLCAEADLLSMWRSYGGREAYAIGFPARALHEVARSAGGYLAPVHYATPWDPPNLTANPDPATGVLEMSSMEAAEIKHPGFIEEREYRLIVPADDTNLTVQYREGPQGCTPYVELPLGEIKSVAVWGGPGVGAQNVRSLRGLLAEHRWPGVTVEVSGIPLR